MTNHTEYTESDFETNNEGKVTAPEIARVLGMNPKSVRRRIRNMTPDRAGKGNEWRFSPEAAAKVANRIVLSNGRTTTEFTFGDD